MGLIKVWRSGQGNVSCKLAMTIGEDDGVRAIQPGLILSISGLWKCRGRVSNDGTVPISTMRQRTLPSAKFYFTYNEIIIVHNHLRV